MDWSAVDAMFSRRADGRVALSATLELVVPREHGDLREVVGGHGDPASERT